MPSFARCRNLQQPIHFWLLLVFLHCATFLGCNPSSPNPSSTAPASQPSATTPPDAGEVQAAIDSLNSIFALDWMELRDAVADGDKEQIDKYRKSIAGIGSVGFDRRAEIVADAKLDVTERLLATELLGEMAGSIKTLD